MKKLFSLALWLIRYALNVRFNLSDLVFAPIIYVAATGDDVGRLVIVSILAAIASLTWNMARGRF